MQKRKGFIDTGKMRMQVAIMAWSLAPGSVPRPWVAAQVPAEVAAHALAPPAHPGEAAPARRGAQAPRASAVQERQRAPAPQALAAQGQ